MLFAPPLSEKKTATKPYPISTSQKCASAGNGSVKRRTTRSSISSSLAAEKEKRRKK
jgi:hypothetical protein